MTSKAKIDSLIEDLQSILISGSNTFNGSIDGQGLVWESSDYNKQFVFHNNPDRFFSSENIEFAKGKGIYVDGIVAISNGELGKNITKSNIRELGRLKKLDIDGDLSVNSFLFYDSISDRLGLGTDTPNAAFSVFDLGVEIVVGSRDFNKGGIGTFNHTDLELVTDNATRLSIAAGGDIDLGNVNFNKIKVTVHGSLGINNTRPDPRVDLDVAGAVKINGVLHLKGQDIPVDGNYNQGDIVWNIRPRPGSFIGWVCTKTGTPGVWNAFGEIK